jgi:Ran GTPase-activating protein (RanGAP) involved in mRNA processing and transport
MLALSSQNMTLQKIDLHHNFMTSTGVGVLLEAMEQTSHHITDLDIHGNRIEDEGASLLASGWERTRCQTSQASAYLLARLTMLGS